MKNNIIHYICCFYFGPRQNKRYSEKLKKDPCYFLDKHISFLKTCNNDVKSATFVFNVDDNDPIINLLEKYFSSYVPMDVDVEFCIRKNAGFSYGAWGDIIQKKLHSNIDYFFIIEDDYLPSCSNFYEPFVSKCSDQHPYVCSKVIGSCRESNLPHASISNGLLKKDVCEKVYDVNGRVFDINLGKTYVSAYQNQLFFYRLFQNLGYGMTDIIDEYKVPFMISDTNKATIFGNVEKLVLINPIEV